ncbi:OsmC family protein [Flavobacterium agricola]|uniref:OsmC family protein n=1 Tax=Flavobacterium agricola TaxID=2870839 RepID=A0ABY6M0K8_9FLAO|nr:OsmC family protein [Flavobacterium agricola]UYW01209.1 OsmC family protein [Flavobacterium agricola]
MSKIDQVKTKWLGNMRFESTNPGGNLFIDAGPENGGEGNGYRPKALMLSALAGCAGLDIAHLIPKMKLEVDDFSIDIDGELTETDPATYKKVTLYFSFYGPNLDSDKLMRAVNLSVDKYCGVLEMFRQFAEIDIKVNFNS